MGIRKRWQVDRHIPVAVIFTLLLQIVGALFWAAQLDARVVHVEEQSSENAESYEKLARIEERLDYVKQDLSVMKRQLDNLINALVKK